MDSISNSQSPLPAQDSASIALKGINAFKQETSELLAMAQEAALAPPTPPSLGNKVDLQA
jgi:hypothetical protein